MDRPSDSVPFGRTTSELAKSLQESQRIAGLGSFTLDLKTRLWSILRCPR